MDEENSINSQSETLQQRLEAIVEELKPDFPDSTLKVIHYDPRIYLHDGNPDAIRAWGADQNPFYKIMAEKDKTRKFLFMKFKSIEETELVLVRNYSEPWVDVKHDGGRNDGILVERPGDAREIYFEIPENTPEPAIDIIVSKLTDFAATNNYKIVD